MHDFCLYLYHLYHDYIFVITFILHLTLRGDFINQELMKKGKT